MVGRPPAARFRFPPGTDRRRNALHRRLIRTAVTDCRSIVCRSSIDRDRLVAVRIGVAASLLAREDRPVDTNIQGVVLKR
ncbi:hypothetical protein D8S78_09355 [Natrialba swarupiae]|nr:hypothetical protein [Natrialba swarupiae]